MHRIAPRLSAIVERSNSASDEHKTIRRNLVKFFADFMRKLIESGGSKPSQLTSPPSAHHEKLFVRLTYPKEIQVEIDGDIVKAIMELLSESFGDYEVFFQKLSFKNVYIIFRSQVLNTKRVNI